LDTICLKQKPLFLSNNYKNIIPIPYVTMSMRVIFFVSKKKYIYININIIYYNKKFKKYILLKEIEDLENKVLLKLKTNYSLVKI